MSTVTQTTALPSTFAYYFIAWSASTPAQARLFYCIAFSHYPLDAGVEEVNKGPANFHGRGLPNAFPVLLPLRWPLYYVAAYRQHRLKRQCAANYIPRHPNIPRLVVRPLPMPPLPPPPPSAPSNQLC